MDTEAVSPCIFLVRHGESEWQTRASSSKDSDLSIRGYKQAQFLTERILATIKKRAKPFVIYSSPLRRAIQTVDLLGVEYVVLDQMKEAIYDVKERLPTFTEKAIYLRTVSNDSEYLEFKKNIAFAMENIILDNAKNDRDVYIFCHGGVIKTIFRILHDNDAICYKISNCSVSSLTWTLSRWHVDFINDTRHLPDDLLT
jgi:broad specificity phosphatase PhoE